MKELEIIEVFNKHLESLEWDKNNPVQIAMYLRLFDATKSIVNKLNLHGVVLRSELLLAYHEWYLKNRGTVTDSSPKAMIEMYLSQ